MAFYVYWNKLHVLVSFTLAITYAYIYGSNRIVS